MLSFNGFVVLGKVLSSFIISKVSAIYLGPSGYALVGNFRNILQGVLGVTSTGFQSGVIRYIAENRKDNNLLKKVVTNVFAFNVAILAVICSFVFFFSEELAVYALKDEAFAYIFKYLSFLLPLVSLNFLVIYIVNGQQKFKLYTILVSAGNILNALLTFLFIYYFGLKGALISSLVVPSLSLIVSFLFKDVRISVFQKLGAFKELSLNFFRYMSSYLFMAFYSTVLISLSYLLIRNSIIDNINLEMAGLWEAMNKISMFYMMFFSSLITLYLLPKLSENTTVKGYYSIMRNYLKVVLPIACFGFLLVFLLKVFIIKFFLTNEFIFIKEFFYLQLIGDLFKVVAFSIAYQFHAKRMISCYLISDAFLYGLYYFLSVYLLKDFNIIGVYYAYLCSTFIYLIVVVLCVYATKSKYLLDD